MRKDKKNSIVKSDSNHKTEVDWKPGIRPNFLNAFESSHESIILIDKNRKIKFWNYGSEIVFGFSANEILEKPLEALFPVDLNLIQNQIIGLSDLIKKSSVNKTHAGQKLPVLGTLKSGEKIPLEIHLNGSLEGEDLILVLVHRIGLDDESITMLKWTEARHNQIQSELEYRIRFENLITSISTHFINLPSERVDMGINYALHALGEFAEVDRAYIFLFSPDHRLVDNSHEWVNHGVQPQIQNLKGLSVERFPWFMDRIEKLQSIFVPKVFDLPEEAKPEREEFEREGIHSLVIVPMVHRGTLRGYLGFDSVKKEKKWPEDITGLLRIAGEMFVSAIERKKGDQALSEAKAKYLNIFENAVEGIFQSTISGSFLSVNPAMARIFGFANPSEMTESVHNIGEHLYLKKQNRIEFMRVVHERGFIAEFESQVIRKDGSIIWISENAREVKKVDGSFDFFEGTVMEITERKLMEGKLIHGALHDSLTGLSNRTLLMDRLERAIERTQRKPNELFALYMLDLDRFKTVNDSMGHLYGDKMLIAFARRLEKFIPPGTTLSRLGGDEFCMLVEELRDIGQATVIAENLLDVLSSPLEIEDQEIYTAASIGIVIGQGDKHYPESLLRDADTALHRAKSSGKGRFEVFDESMHAKAVHLLTLETDLRKALERSEFRLHYQPIVSLENSSLIGFEALIRWIHPTLKLVNPLDFIPLAEDTGLIIPIGRWVIWEACRQLSIWQKLYSGQKLTMAVNLSGKQLVDLDLVRQVQAILTETKVNPTSLKLEVTESAIMENPDRAATILTQLKEMGIQLSLDDFGTGYSSLSYLHRFPFHILKIDRSFVSKMELGNKDTEIVKVINSLATNLGMHVVAEGIETLDQWAILEGLTCAYGQGYYFSKPLEESRATELVAAGGFPKRSPKV